MFFKIPLTNVKAVLLDLDNTLYKHDTCHEKALMKCWHYFRETINSKTSIKKLNETYQNARKIIQTRLFPGGSCRSRLLYFQTFFELFNLTNSYTLALQFESLYNSTFLNEMTCNEDAKQFLIDCNNKQIKICIITNLTTQFQIKKINTLLISDYITYLVSSEEAGVEKPDPLIFELALKKLNVDKKHIIMIGDSKTCDISPATKLGIKSYLIKLQ
tara:strand:+ start:198 stop:845 length:648 start_codon:yes stop_codon:yes gene_type:complete